MRDVTIDNWSYRPEPGDRDGGLPPRWQEALAALAFRPVGVLVRRLPPMPRGAQMPVVDVPRWQPADGERIAVWGGPDGRAFAVVEPYFEEALLSFRTLAASGEIVETIVASRRPPAQPPDSLTASTFGGGWLSGRFRPQARPPAPAAGGEEPEAAVEAEWIRTSRPDASYYLERVEVDPGSAPAAVAATLWARHKARLKERLPAGEIPRHDDLTLYLALLLRIADVVAAAEQRVTRLDQRATILLVGLAVLVAVFLPLLLLAGGGFAAAFVGPATWVGGALLLLMGVILVQWLLRRRFSNQPLPLVPAATLVERVRG